MYDLIVIGGGPAGLAAACSAWEKGLKKILVIERDQELGGILNQCIHSGFGLQYFKEELSGPEYAARFADLLAQTGVEVRLDTMVLQVTPERQVHMVGKSTGYCVEQAKAIVLAMGCRERTRGAIAIPGTRPAGVFTAGAAQRYVNVEGYLPGKRVVILGSGDIGLIMARRMTLEGAKVKCVAELMPYSGGLKRNIVQCLDDFGIPLKLSHTVVDIQGKERVTGVTIAQVDGQNKPIPGTEEHIPCDTLLLSVGLLPENELSKAVGVELSAVTGGPTVNESLETNIPGVFACGNVLHVHDLVDYVSEEAQQAGRHAAAFVAAGGKAQQEREIPLKPQGAARYTVPVTISPERMEEKLMVRFRVSRNIRKGVVKVYADDKLLYQRKRPVMAPGEMEQVVFEKQWFTGGEQEIRVVVEEEAQ